MTTVISDEIQVNTQAVGAQIAQIITALDNGGWVVSWTTTLADAAYIGNQAQVFSADGTKSGSELTVLPAASVTYAAAITGLAGGDWLYTYATPGLLDVYQQRYNLDGTTDGSAVKVSTDTTNYKVYPTVTTLEDGGWVVAWQSSGQDGDGYGIYQQRYNANGTVNGLETLVNTQVTGGETEADVTSLASGGWIVTWTSAALDSEGYSLGVHAQIFDATGAKSG